MAIKYFLSYNFTNPEDDTHRHGNCECDRDLPIINAEDITSIQNMLGKQKGLKINIRTWKRFEKNNLWHVIKRLIYKFTTKTETIKEGTDG